MIVAFELAPCLSEYSELTESVFVGCLDDLNVVASNLPTWQLPRGTEPMGVAALLQEHPGRTLSWTLEAFRTLLLRTENSASATVLQPDVVSAEEWFFWADLHDRFMADNPDVADKFRDAIFGSAFVNGMQRLRDRLLAFRDAIRTELVAFQDGTRPSVFSELFDGAWPSVEARVQAWGQSGGDYGHQSVKAVEYEMATRNAYLRSWLALAFYDVIGDSEPLNEIMRRDLRLPDRMEDWTPGESGPVGAMAMRLKIREAVDRVTEVLKSPPLRDVVTYGYEHRLLTGTRFEWLGDVR